MLARCHDLDGRAPSLRARSGVEIAEVSPLPDFGESEFSEKRYHLARFQNRQFAHPQATSTVCVPTKTLSNRGSPSSDDACHMPDQFVRRAHADAGTASRNVFCVR